MRMKKTSFPLRITSSYYTASRKMFASHRWRPTPLYFDHKHESLSGQENELWKNIYTREYCLHPWSSRNFHDRHILECSDNLPELVLYPEEGSISEWTKTIEKCELLPFVIYADLESVLTPVSFEQL